MVVSILILTAFFITISMTAVAAWSDFRIMKIENYVSIIILVSFIIALALDILLLPNTSIFGTWWSGPIASIIVFAITFGMFTAGMIGGGDSKLASVLALWVGLKGIIALLFYMSLAGGFLALIAVICRKKPFLKSIANKMGKKSWVYALYNGKNALPYGIALFIGAIGAFGYIELFQRIIDSVEI